MKNNLEQFREELPTCFWILVILTWPFGVWIAIATYKWN